MSGKKKAVDLSPPLTTHRSSHEELWYKFYKFLYFYNFSIDTSI